MASKGMQKCPRCLVTNDPKASEEQRGVPVCLNCGFDPSVVEEDCIIRNKSGNPNTRAVSSVATKLSDVVDGSQPRQVTRARSCNPGFSLVEEDSVLKNSKPLVDQVHINRSNRQYFETEDPTKNPAPSPAPSTRGPRGSVISTTSTTSRPN